MDVAETRDTPEWKRQTVPVHELVAQVPTVCQLSMGTWSKDKENRTEKYCEPICMEKYGIRKQSFQ